MTDQLRLAAIVAGISFGACVWADPVVHGEGANVPQQAERRVQTDVAPAARTDVLRSAQTEELRLAQNDEPAEAEGSPRDGGGQAGRQRGPRGPGGPRGGQANAGAASVPGTESGFATFQNQCTVCHGNPNVPRAPSPEAIRQMSPEKIYEALSTGGVMAAQGAALSDIQKQRVAEFMSGRPLGSSGSGDASKMPNRCTENPELAGLEQNPLWNGWGVDLGNTRAQAPGQAGLTAADVPKLELKWAFGYPAGVSSNAQPTVAAGRIFVGSDNGFVYSLDAKSGCVYWSFEAGSIVRNSVVVGAVTGRGDTRYAAYFGDGHANIYAVDAHHGTLLWKKRVDDHFVARITAGVKLYEGKLFVPVSSSEEFSSGNPDYPCCTARGSVVALDANTGKEIWKAWVIPEEPKPYKTQANGVTLYRPAGGAVWNTPTVDPARHAVYFGTGDATTAPSPKTTDGIMAVDIDTGKFLWAYQATENDVFMGGCNGENRSAACPEPLGPDMDIGNSPILATLPSGKQVVLAGTKAGDVFALDPDDHGKLLYRVNLAGGEPGGVNRFGGASIVWGGAVGGAYAYYGLGNAGLAAFDPATGRRAWLFTPPSKGAGPSSLGAAPTTIPGVVFEGSNDGTLYAVSAADGKQLWSFDTAQALETVDKVPAHGGAIASSGAVIAGGMVYVGSGYAIGSGASAGNLLLAFGVAEGR
ncbi:MAG TPA: PQQ-binding-like beta-propeller repeat protein [Gammaproteobacteria bacterium]|nr:PQQ-binding-like beta-propeller repeat protein [Gammaproteobacteria bacterium]